MKKEKRNYDICIIGGCGHVGLPLGALFASKGEKVALYDINSKSVDIINSGKIPFSEKDPENIFKKSIKSKNLTATTSKKIIKKSKILILTINTPLDKYLNPDRNFFIKAINEINDYIDDKHILIIRSTVYPGTTEWTNQYFKKQKKKTLVAFCPERILEGNSFAELQKLPQIVSGCNSEAKQRASTLFRKITNKTIFLSPKEAELAKLMTNAWRYINFSISNQFYMIAHQEGADFYKMYKAMTQDYPRLKSFSRAGFTAGPCLLKDTLSLSFLLNGNFLLGQAATTINEGFPSFIVASLKKKYKLSQKTVGILGMAFKANSNNPTESLSYKLKKILEIEAKKVLCNDPHIKEKGFVSIETIRKNADIVILATPHDEYIKEKWNKNILIDIWNCYN